MTHSSHELSARAAELRDAFDRSFALALVDIAETRQMFLILGIGTESYAIMLDALLGIENHRKIVPIPHPAPGLLGLAGLRGQMAPVFSLASLLGSVGGVEPPTWLVFCKGPSPVALAFDRFAGSAQAGNADIYTAETTGGLPPLVTQTLRIGTGILPILDVPTLTAALRQRLKKS